MAMADTLKLAQKLEAAGFNREQATGAAAAIGEAMTGDLATKTDIADLRGDLGAAKVELGWIKWALAIFVAAHLAEISMLFTLLSRTAR